MFYSLNVLMILKRTASLDKRVASKNRQNAEENEITRRIPLSCLLGGSHLQSGTFPELPAQISLLV